MTIEELLTQFETQPDVERVRANDRARTTRR